MSDNEYHICDRLERLRVELFGHRGKSEMARHLGIRPSTYDRYERDRVPPADLLVKVGRIADVTLEWLLTGDGPKRPEKIADVEAETLTRRFKELLVTQPSFRSVAAGFMDWIDTATVEAKRSVKGSLFRDDLIPILGGIDEVGPEEERLAMIGGHGLQEQNRSFFATVNGEPTVDSQTFERYAADGSPSGANNVAIAHFPDESAPSGSRSFIDAPSFRESYPDAVGWIVSDTAMDPQFAVGDLLVTSPTALAVAGQPAIVRLESQSGLTLRVYHREGADVLLIPANSRVPVTRVPEQDLIYAYRVLGVIRGAVAGRPYRTHQADTI